jgi:pyruvate,water dikinase
LGAIFFGPISPSYVDSEFGAPPRVERIVVDGYLYSSVPPPAKEPSAAEVAATEKELRDHHERVVLRRWRKTILPALLKKQQRFRELDLPSLTDGGLLEHIHELSNHIQEIHSNHNTNIPAWSLVIGRLALFYQEHLGTDDSKLLALLAGFSPIIHEPLDRLESLAEEARRRPALMASLEGPDPWSDPAVREYLQPYLAAFGHNGFRVDYSAPTPAEQPERVVQILREVVARLNREQDRSSQRLNKSQEQREEDTATLKQRLPDGASRSEFDRRLAEARVAYGVRDEDIELLNIGRTYMRYSLLETGRRLAERGLLVDAQRVFYLLRAEVEKALAGQPATDLLQRSEARWADYRRQQAMDPPPLTFGTKPKSPPAPPRQPLTETLQRAQEARQWYFSRVGVSRTTSADLQAPDDTKELRGIGASPGCYTGQARVVRSLEEFDRVSPGDVLVCPTTRPTWIAIFATIGALVTDEGGILSHPAIASREFGIPAVVATRNGTETIPDGQLVQVNGKMGTVRF